MDREAAGLKYAIINFGCRTNRYDAEWVGSSFRAKGMEPVSMLQDADIVIVNTCTVTEEAARQARQAIRRARKLNPHAVIIAAGCAIEAEPGKFLSMHELDYTANLYSRTKIADIVHTLKTGKAPQPLYSSNGDQFDPFPLPMDERYSNQQRSRAVFKIQDGCENRCSFCIVSRIRGQPRSLSTTEIIENLKSLKRIGHGEVVMTGIHLGAWGRDLLPPRSLEDLLKLIGKSKDMPRIRLTSIDPNEISKGLLDLFSSSNVLCPHLHVPLQSGDDEILQAMGRKYTAREAGVRIRLLHQAVSDMAIGLDLIVGFPGESEKHFDRTLETLDGLPFDYLHVFPFSPRPGTPAALMKDDVPLAIKRERGHILRELSAKRRLSFWRGQLGTARNSVVESQLRNGIGWRCRTDNYIPVVIGSGEYKIGEILPVRLVSFDVRKVRGEVSL